MKFHKFKLKNWGAGEMAQWVAQTAAQSYESEFKTSVPMQRFSCGHVFLQLQYNVGMDIGGFLGPVDYLTKPRFNERCCLKGIKWRVIENNTQHPPLAFLHAHECFPFHMCIPYTQSPYRNSKIFNEELTDSSCKSLNHPEKVF